MRLLISAANGKDKDVAGKLTLRVDKETLTAVDQLAEAAGLSRTAMAGELLRMACSQARVVLEDSKSEQK